jgi:hypothetical protein
LTNSTDTFSIIDFLVENKKVVSSIMYHVSDNN